MTPEAREPGRGINIFIDDEPPITGARIKVIGIGGGGGNAVNRMIDTQVRGVRFIAMNTDSQVLDLSPATSRICLGQHYTQGLGAGGNASVALRTPTPGRPWPWARWLAASAEVMAPAR